MVKTRLRFRWRQPKASSSTLAKGCVKLSHNGGSADPGIALPPSPFQCCTQDRNSPVSHLTLARDEAHSANPTCNSVIGTNSIAYDVVTRKQVTAECGRQTGHCATMEASQNE